jgi:hypothetical protein
MDFLLDHFEHAKDKYKDDPYMSPCCNAGWAKIDKYYSLTDSSPAYIAALVLAPQYKWDYFVHSWEDHPEWIIQAKTTMQEFWRTSYKSSVAPISTLAAPKPPLTNSFLRWQAEKQGPDDELDEYEQYIVSPRLREVKDARSWWLEPTQRKTYPNLQKMALDLLSIPAMSAEPERLFSNTKITITDRRNRLGIKSIEAIECLKSWLIKGSTAWVDDEEKFTNS